MNVEVLRKVQSDNLKKSIPALEVGDTVAVETIIREGNKQRIQVFKGIIIAVKNSGLDKTFTVRKISYGVGVEKIFPLYSSNIASIKILKHANVRRSKLYYMRKRIGKAAMKLKPGEAVTPVEHQKEAQEQLAQEANVPVQEPSPETRPEENNTQEETEPAN